MIKYETYGYILLTLEKTITIALGLQSFWNDLQKQDERKENKYSFKFQFQQRLYDIIYKY